MNNAQIEINGVYDRISSYIRKTPQIHVEVQLKTGIQKVVLKLEHLQIGGSFKTRGALSKISKTENNSVVAFSGGNHGIGVAYAAKCLGKKAIIYLPNWAPDFKKKIILSYGAELRMLDEPMNIIMEKAYAYADHSSAVFIHPYDDLDIIYGAATVGLEIDNIHSPNIWFAGVGGGGLTSGLTLALPSKEIIPVESVLCSSLFAAQHNNSPVSVIPSGIAQSGLGAPSIGQQNWKILKLKNHPVIRVSDAMIQLAQKWLWDHCKILVEPSGGAAMAAIFDESWKLSTDPVGIILCGANTHEMPS